MEWLFAFFGTLTITGRKNGVTEYTITLITGDFQDPQDTATNNGFTYINFVTQGGVDNSNKVIDELVFSSTGNLDYMALDAFRWDLISKVWDGSTDTDWSTTANWSSDILPIASDDVVIPNVTNKPIISATTGAVADNLSVNAGSKNPQIIQYNKEIEILKINLKQSISNLIASLETQYNQINKEANKVKYKVSTIPLLERGFIDIARQQEIISGLYEYLLKKKEETAISLAVTVPNAKIIDKAYSAGIPVSPKRKIIYLAAILLGLIIPFIVIYLRNLLDTKVHSKKDIESALTVPFLGDIPRSESKEKVIVGSDARSSGSEAFRLVRTNLDFMLASKKGSKKFIFITSTTSGEGKSFISINVSATLALSGKKVLLIGMDLRAPKVTEYLGLESKKGVTNYITSNDLTLDELKFQIPQAPTLDIISSGAIPPNPAELLSGDNVKNLFEEIDTEQDYDYVVVDTAPVNLVTDTLLISKYADMFLYIVRANYLDKRLLAVPQELYKNKRLPNMSIVLNDTDPKRSYGYGYGYGGYGYGYLAEEEQGKSWFGKIFNRS